MLDYESATFGKARQCNGAAVSALFGVGQILGGHAHREFYRTAEESQRRIEM